MGGSGYKKCCVRYVVAFVLTYQLPFPSKERPLHDIDDPKTGNLLKRKRLGVSYQSV